MRRLLISLLLGIGIVLLCLAGLPTSASETTPRTVANVMTVTIGGPVTRELNTAYTFTVSLVNAQAFLLSVASGESLKVVVSAGKISEMAGGTISTTSAERAVQVIRKILREKK
ncbi:MAG: hypothetical protein JXA33_16920 [Anaerolineae bacterium]|nr:hypothetical protein [Anaerolineae bacterium]